MVPILVVAGHAAHLDSEKQADMVHGNFSQDALKSGAPIGRLTSAPLVLVDEQDPVFRPPEGDCELNQSVLPLARLDVVEDLLGIRLANVDDGQPVEVPIIERRWAQPQASRDPRGDSPFAERRDRAPSEYLSCAHGLPPGWQEALRAAEPRSD
jgi:hypothetical protein